MHSPRRAEDDRAAQTSPAATTVQGPRFVRHGIRLPRGDMILPNPQTGATASDQGGALEAEGKGGLAGRPGVAQPRQQLDRVVAPLFGPQKESAETDGRHGRTRHKL